MNKDKFLSEIRKAVTLGIDQKEIAKEACLTEITVSKYVNGHSNKKSTMQIILNTAKSIALIKGNQLLKWSNS